MPSEFREPKNLPEWVELDYYERPRFLQRLWRPLIWGTLLVGGVAMAGLYFFSRTKTIYQAGPLSQAHAYINDQCNRCHTQGFETAKRLLPTNTHFHSVSDDACKDCHKDQPDHNAFLPRGIDQHCSECHREHRGRVALSRLPDSECTVCHRDLPAHREGEGTTAFADVKGFPDGHPPFAQTRYPDPGQLLFNHKVHLREEGVPGPGGKLQPLGCQDCHQPDGTGRYMKPINYDLHCRECHPLNVTLTGRFPDPKAQKAWEQFAGERVPHGVPPAFVRAVLRDRLLRLVRDHSLVPVKDPPEPLRALPRPNRLEAVTEREWGWSQGKLSEIEKIFFLNNQLVSVEGVQFSRPGGCVFCHVPEKTPKGEPAFDAEGLPVFQKTGLPSRWMRHARFSHERHPPAAIACETCHENKRTSENNREPAMPTKEICARCHAPVTGARNDCVECHTYHPRDPLTRKIE